MKNKKKTLIKPLILSAFLLFGGLGAALSANASTGRANAVQAISDSDDGLYTTITLTDTCGWKYRTLWLDNFTYADGYNQDQRNLFLAGQYLYNFEQWDGTAKNGERGIGYHTSGNGTNLSTGALTTTVTFYLPAWITNCTVQVEDDNNQRYLGPINDISVSSGGLTPSEEKAGNGVGKTINIECKTDQGLNGGAFVTISDTKNYSDSVTVNRYFLKSDGSSVKATDSVTRHKYYFGTVDKVAVDGYATNNKWYLGTTYAASEEYSTSNILTSTDAINLVAKYDVGSNDSTIEIRFTRPLSWENNAIAMHTWNEGGAGTTFPGYLMTWLWNNNLGEGIFSWSPSFDEPLYGNIIFNTNNNWKQTPTLTTPSTSKWYYSDGWHDVDTMIVYLFDYANVYEGHVNVSASRGTSFAEEYVAEQMIDVATNGLMYKVVINNRYNSVVFSNNGEDATASLTPSGNYVYVLGGGIDDWWNNINYALAYNFAMRTMLMDTIPTTETGTTRECAEHWAAAETHFNALMASSYGEYVLAQLNTGFATAMERFSEWAKANGKSLNTSTGVISTNNTVLMSADMNNTVLILVIVSISLVTVGGYFLLRRKHR